MKIVVSQDALRRAVEHVAAVASPQGVLQHVLLDVQGSVARLTGASDEMSLTLNLDCVVQGDGAATFPATVLRDYVSNLPAGKVTLRSESAGLTIVESEGGPSARIAGVDPAEFPQPSRIKYRGVDLPIEAIRTGSDLVSFAVSTDRARPLLSGVSLDVTSERVRLTATDTYRLALVDLPGNPSARAALRAILPPRSLSVLQKIAEEAETVRIGAPEQGEGQVGFMLANAELTVRLIAGTYPDVSRVIPAETKTQAIVDRRALMQVVQRVIVLSNNDTRRLEMDVSSGRIDFGGKSQERGAANDHLRAEVAGEHLHIAVNGEFFLRILSKIPGERVALSFAGPERAFVLSPEASALPEGWKATYVLMPLRDLA